jgi:ABC-type dipeptide/oligopeptide/nickel transport system permease subunit
LESWKVGKLESWKVGKLESWEVGKLVSWEVGKLVSWKVGKVGSRDKACLVCTRKLGRDVAVQRLYGARMIIVFFNYK